MEKASTPQGNEVISVFNAFVRLNEMHGNKWLISQLKIMFCAWLQSSVSEDTDGEEREAIGLVFFDLLDAIRATGKLKEVTLTDPAAEPDLVLFLVEKGLWDEFLNRRTIKSN